MEKKHVVGNLKDFDWQLNLALSSDSLASLNKPLVNLDIETSSKNNFHADINSVEMNSSELDLMISKLEAAEKALLDAGS